MTPDEMREGSAELVAKAEEAVEQVPEAALMVSCVAALIAGQAEIVERLERIAVAVENPKGAWGGKLSHDDRKNK